MNSSHIWYVDVEGRRVGPYSLEQIHGLIREGEIPSDCRITADHLIGEWIPAQDAKDISHLDRFPPRPPDLSSHQNFTFPPLAVDTETTQSLFETLQAAKEKKSRFAVPPSPSLKSGKKSKIPAWLSSRWKWVTLAAIFFLPFAWWISRTFVNRPDDAVSSSASLDQNKPIPATIPSKERNAIHPPSAPRFKYARAAAAFKQASSPPREAHESSPQKNEAEQADRRDKDPEERQTENQQAIDQDPIPTPSPIQDTNNAE